MGRECILESQGTAAQVGDSRAAQLEGWAGRMFAVTKPYPEQFRDDVVCVVRDRELGVELTQIAKDFGIHFTNLCTWMKKAEIGERPGAAAAQSAELREPKKRRTA